MTNLVSKEESNGAAGMDVFASLFAIFVLVAVSLANAVDPPSIDEYDRRLLIIVEIVGEEVFPFDVSYDLRNQKGGFSRRYTSGETRRGNLGGGWRMLADKSAAMLMEYDPIVPGAYELIVGPEDAGEERRDDVTVCVSLYYPLQKTEHPRRDCKRNRNGTITREFVVDFGEG